MNQRIHWMDVARCFGIFAIYLGHCGEAAGAACDFVHTHHVAMFFLLSGCAENFNRQPGIRSTVRKICRRILLPWLVFCVLSYGFLTVVNFGDWPYLYEQLLTIPRGTMRGQFAAGSLWFLTCLAMVQLLFSLVRKLKHPLLILAGTIPFYYFIQMMKLPNPLVLTTWAFNLDCAFLYLLYYTLGFVIFPYAHRALNPVTGKGKALLWISAAGALAYAVLVYLRRDPLTIAEDARYSLVVHPVLRALIIIWVYFVAAKQLEDCQLLQKIGINTLYLCGGEYIIKSLPAAALSLVGISLYPGSLLTSLAHSALMLVLGMVFFVPPGKAVLQKLETAISALLPRKEKSLT